MGAQTGMTPLARVLAHVEHARKNGKGYMAQCPVPQHRDRQPSLSIGEAEDGNVLLKCHAGCTFEDIVAALDLTAKDLFSQVTGGEGGITPHPMQRLQRLQRSSTAAP
jgi:hypothetical protein